MTNDINNSHTAEETKLSSGADTPTMTTAAIDTSNVNIQQQKQQIAHNKLKQYESDMTMVNSGCLYQLFAPFLLLFGIVPTQQSIVDVKPPTRDETSSLLIGDNSDSDEDDDYNLYNNPSNIDDQVDESRIIRQEKTILDHQHGGLSHHDELESYLNQSLENATTILHKDEQTVYSKFKDTSYRNIHRENTNETPRQPTQSNNSVTAINYEIPQNNVNTFDLIETQEDKFMEVMNQFNNVNLNNFQPLKEESIIATQQPSTSTNTTSQSNNFISKEGVQPNQINNNSTNNTLPIIKSTTTEEPLSKITTPTINPIIQTNYNDEEEDEEVSFGQFQQHYEDDSEDDIEINYQ